PLNTQKYHGPISAPDLVNAVLKKLTARTKLGTVKTIILTIFLTSLIASTAAPTAEGGSLSPCCSGLCSGFGSCFRTSTQFLGTGVSGTWSGDCTVAWRIFCPHSSQRNPASRNSSSRFFLPQCGQVMTAICGLLLSLNTA